MTNAFIPCNGRFPILIALLSMFLASSGLVSALWLLGLLLLAAAMTLLCTFLLSKTPVSYTHLDVYKRQDYTRIT